MAESRRIGIQRLVVGSSRFIGIGANFIVQMKIGFETNSSNNQTGLCSGSIYFKTQMANSTLARQKTSDPAIELWFDTSMEADNPGHGRIPFFGLYCQYQAKSATMSWRERISEHIEKNKNEPCFD